MYIGDFRLGDTFDLKFTTRQVSGAPTTLAGSPVISAYPGNSVTQLTAGITLTVDFDSVTGLHNVRVVATSGNGYAAATNYYLVITTGTVNSVSVVGEVIGSFSIECRSALMPTTAARTLVVDAAGLADANAVKVGPTGSGTAQTAGDIPGKTNSLTFTVANQIDSNVIDWKGSAAPAMTGDAFARLGAPAGASVSADVAAVKVDTAAVKVQTDKMTFTVANKMDSNVLTWNGTAVAAPATAGIPEVNVKNINNVSAAAVTTVKAVQGLAVDGVIPTATNLTNAPTNGDFTAVMKTSIGTAVAASAVASVTAAVAITSSIKKNQALAKFQFLLTDSTTHAPKTGATVTCTRSIDGGAFAAGTLANVTEVSNGTYTVDFGAGDLNGNVIVLRATASGSDDTFERIVTQP